RYRDFKVTYRAFIKLNTVEKFLTNGQ
ncbi:MAG: hypothetical protein Q613_PSC00301G0001, partial [Propionibacterium sp. DORA_15]